MLSCGSGSWCIDLTVNDSSLQHQKCHKIKSYEDVDAVTCPVCMKYSLCITLQHVYVWYQLPHKYPAWWKCLLTGPQITLIVHVASPYTVTGIATSSLSILTSRHTDILTVCLCLCLCHSDTLFLCLSLSSCLHSLIGATKGKYACELQEVYRIHSQLRAGQNHRGWCCTHTYSVIVKQSIIFVSL